MGENRMTLEYANASTTFPRKPIYTNLTVQVLLALSIGIFIGALRPEWGRALRPLGDGFIKLVKMVVAPIIFLTVSLGIAGMGDLKKAGRIGLKALLYFEIVTTLALMIGLIVVNVMRPGIGIDTQTLATPEAQQQVSQYIDQGKKQTTVEFLFNMIPDNIVSAFARNDILQILVFAILFGIAIARIGKTVPNLINGLEQLTRAMFGVVSLIIKVAPLGAMGAMAYTIGAFGIKALWPLLKLMGCVYLTMAIFIFLILGLICRTFGFSLLKYLRFIKEEILLVLGTSSSESALPLMIKKMEAIGCNRQVVDLVIPTGYSFNLDGTSIYLSMAAIFIAQAFGVHMSLGSQLYVLALLMLTSKGAAAVTGGGFITLAATLSATHVLPVEGLALLLGVDRFMSEARAITNLIGNGVATICVSKMEGEFDQVKYEAAVASGNAVLAYIVAEQNAGA